MSVEQIQRKTLAEHVYENLLQEITSGGFKPGERLPSMSKLAEAFGTSINPVQRGLERLAEEGYVEKRPGSGTYVIDSSPPTQMSDTVVLCMQSEAHVWGQLSHLMANRLHQDQVMPLLVNPKNENAPDILRGLARSDARAFVVLGNPGFPLHMFESAPFQNKIILGLIEWIGDAFPGLLRVLADHRCGGRMVARHLYRVGHRNVLMIAAPLQSQKMRTVLAGGQGPHGRGIDQNGHGVAFLRDWRELGGNWEIISSSVKNAAEGDLVALDENDLLSRLTGDDPPTAIFGWRDVEAAAAQKALRENRPDLMDKVEITGYFDTPWSRGAHPPFTTVNLNLETIVEEACGVLETRLRGEAADAITRWVKPRLVLR
jgi:DNA-binding LacI/PurR family transcriptional regulator